MKLNPKNILFGGDEEKKGPVLLTVTPPRTGERTLLGVENLLQSIAVPEPFSLELAGDMDGVTLMARCLDDQVVRGQLSAHYPQARIQKLDPDDDPLRTGEGEQAWSVTLRADGPEYLPLRTFRDDDLLDPGSDPLIALMGALSALYEGERVVARLLLRSLGPDWSQAHLDKAHKQPSMEPREPAYTFQTKPLQMDGVTMAVLGIGALAALKGYLWVQDGEIWKAALLGMGMALGLAVGGFAWHRWKKARKRVEDPLLIKEKVSRIAFDAELQIVAVVPAGTGPQRAGELLGRVAAAYRHFDNPAGARFKVGGVRPIMPDPEMLHPAGPGLFGGRSRQLFRNIEHTAAVHGFLAALTAQAPLLGWEIAQLDPPRRASRHFRHDGGMRAVNPDAFGVLTRDDTRWPFFLEWERRAVRPSTMSERLAPYLRYYSSHRPVDDHGTRPSVLVVFDDEIAHTHFLRVAREEMRAEGVTVPLWVSHKEAIDALGPLGRAWRTPREWESPQALPPQ